MPQLPTTARSSRALTRQLGWVCLLGVTGACQEPAPTATSAATTAATASQPAAVLRSATTTTATASSRRSCPDAMAYVPARRFRIGSAAGVGEADEHPATQVTLADFCIDRTEVTVAAYGACVAEPRGDRRCQPARSEGRDNCNAGQPDRRQHPINCISWQQAADYCAWRGGRLPSEREWELAARGSDGRSYPWGDEPPNAARLNVCGRECARVHRGWPPMHDGDDGYPKTAPVGQFRGGASPSGLLDAAGNVWEWTDSWHRPYDENSASESAALWRERSKRRVVRGGGWFHNQATRVRAANRHSYPPSESNGHLGMRCAAAAY